MSYELPSWVSGLRCILCGSTSTDAWAWQCICDVDSRTDVVFEEDAPKRMRAKLAERPFDMFRYRELLPLPGGARLPPLSVGGTPVVEAERLARHLDVARVVLKDDGRNPSGSLKDRPSAVGVALAIAAGRDRIVCASTGNAASSTACLAASMGLRATIFVPRRAPEPKIAQLRIFGATVLRVDADYDTTWDLCFEIAKHKPWYSRNCAVNPYLVEGKKTAALELAEQLGPRIPSWVALSVGDGCTIAGVVKGLEEAHAAGLIPFVPRVLGVQAAGAAPIANAFDDGGDLVHAPAETIADSISVAHPRNFRKAITFVRRNEGRYVTVRDDEIEEAMCATASLGGVFGEPAAAAATAGVKVARARGILSRGDDVAILVSGNGLKDAAAALRAAGGPIDVAPTLDAIEAALA